MLIINMAIFWIMVVSGLIAASFGFNIVIVKFIFLTCAMLVFIQFIILTIYICVDYIYWKWWVN
jgi:hypothetical protein